MFGVTAAETFDGVLLVGALFFLVVIGAFGCAGLQQRLLTRRRCRVIRQAGNVSGPVARSAQHPEPELLTLGTGGQIPAMPRSGDSESLAERMMHGLMREAKERRGVYRPLPGEDASSSVVFGPGTMAARMWSGPAKSVVPANRPTDSADSDTVQLDIATLADACGPSQTSIVNTLATVSDNEPQVNPDEVRQQVQRAAEQHGWKRCAHCDEVIPDAELVEDTAGPRPVWLHRQCTEAFAVRFGHPIPVPLPIPVPRIPLGIPLGLAAPPPEVARGLGSLGTIGSLRRYQ